MRFFFRFNNLFLLLSYLVISAIPFFPFTLGRSIDSAIQILVLECVTWGILWATFKRPAYFHFLLLPAFLILPIEIYLQVFYEQGISTHHLGIITETSPREALEFLGRKVWLLLGIMLTVLLWWYFSWKAARRTHNLDWSHYSRWLILILLMCSLQPWNYATDLRKRFFHNSSTSSFTSSAVASETDSSDEEEEGSEEENNPEAGPASTPSNRYIPHIPQWLQSLSWSKVQHYVVPDIKQFEHTWPFGLVAHGVDFWTERRYLSDLSMKNQTFTFGAKRLNDVNKPETFVMVIGESSRYDRWSINSYSRPTNPLLSRESNLVSLTNVITPVSATRLSVPVLISRKPAMQSLKAGFSEKSFLTAFREAGFKTYWLSNQMSFGQFDTPVSVFAKEANVVQFMNLGGYTDHSNFDQVLFSPLETAIADHAPKKLIVLHTLGNHWNYSHRYPKEFDKWQPSLFGVDKPDYTNTDLKPQLNNSYDNSILYTDWFLSQVIKKLKLSEQISSMVYVADHGQTLYDGSCQIAFHGHNTQFEFHIPALIWYSDSYRSNYPEKIKQLKRHKNAKISTENMFHSLVDMADIRYETERLEWSFFSNKFKQHKRYVDSHGWTNYDNANIRGDCREVIDKGKPLQQDSASK